MNDTATMNSAVSVGPAALNHDDLKITFPRVIKFEWIKLISLRSTWITLIAVFALVIGFGIIAAATAGEQSFNTGVAGAVARVLSGDNIAVLVLAVLGVMIGGREFSSGMIRTTLAVVPKRLPTLWAKLLCTFLLVTPVVLLSIFGAFFIGSAILANGSAASASWTDPGVPSAVIGGAGYLIGVTLIGVALGTILRSVAGGVVTLIGIIMFLPQLASMLLPKGWEAVLDYLPSNAASAFTSVVPQDDLLSPVAGVVVFCAWIALAVAGAAFALRTRDA